MKDWSLIGIIIGIIIVLGMGLGEQMYFERVSNDMVAEISKVENLIFVGNIEEGKSLLQDTMVKWEKYKKVLGILMEHEGIKRISLAFIEIDNKLNYFFNIEDVSSNFALLKEYIINIEMENKFTAINVL